MNKSNITSSKNIRNKDQMLQSGYNKDSNKNDSISYNKKGTDDNIMFDSKVRLSINSKPSMNSNLSGLNSANKL